MCGRRFCRRCGRWRHLCDFGYTNRGTQLKSSCASCERIRKRKEKRRYQDNLELPIEPFAQWLERAVRRHGGVERLGEEIGADPAPLRRYIARCEANGEPKRGVRMTTVDRVLTHEGSTHLRELYPSVYEFEEAA